MYPQPKKRLGQHFLHNAYIRAQIVEACRLSSDDQVLEIGAGRGEMTVLIAAHVRRLWAVELDRRMIPMLRAAVADYPNVTVIPGDILKTDLSSFSGPAHSKLTVIGNLPYYLSTPILEHLVKFRDSISRIYVMLQKEYAERVAAFPGSKVFGALSCFIQYYMQPELLLSVSRGAFSPAPKVDSRVLHLSVRERPPFAVGSREEGMFFRIVRAAFSQKRKTLKNSLKGMIDPGMLTQFLHDLKLDARVRPEQLGVDTWLLLAKAVAANKD